MKTISLMTTTTATVEEEWTIEVSDRFDVQDQDHLDLVLSLIAHRHDRGASAKRVTLIEETVDISDDDREITDWDWDSGD